jgi:asparaginyl-tRNA synthetase
MLFHPPKSQRPSFLTACRSIVSRPDGDAGPAGNRVRIGGWVKTGRKADKDSFAFLELNDWSCPGNLQVIVDAAMADLSPLV